MKEKMLPLHKRLAMGDTLKGYAKGGTVGSDLNIISVRPGKAANPLTAAKRVNGIPGYKKGGKC